MRIISTSGTAANGLVVYYYDELVGAARTKARGWWLARDKEFHGDNTTYAQAEVEDALLLNGYEFKVDGSPVTNDDF